MSTVISFMQKGSLHLFLKQGLQETGAVITVRLSFSCQP
jgi:hypothetical protein